MQKSFHNYNCTLFGLICRSTSLAWWILSTQNHLSLFFGLKNPKGWKIPNSFFLKYGQINKKNFSRTELRGAEERHARYDCGTWQKVVFLVLPNKSLLQTSENIFECVASLPDTLFSTSKTTTYNPGTSKKSFFVKEKFHTKKICLQMQANHL